MKVSSRFGVAALLVLALALFVMPAVRAGVWNHATRVTFNNSVQLPGVVLPPGEYRFQLLDSPSNRHVVQVFNADHSHIFGTWITIPVERLEPSGKTIFVMEERPFGEPEAIKEWWYPGELIGDEFIYPKEKSVAVATITPAPEEAVTPAEPVPVAEPEVPVEEVKPVEEPAPVAEPEATAPVEQEPQTAPEKKAEPVKAEEELPQTASNLYLILLLGSISALSGVAIRRFAKS